MSTAVRLSVAQYDRLIAEGAFEGGLTRPRIELIEGELRTMSPIGPQYEFLVDALNGWSHDVTPRDSVLIRIQNSLGLPALDSVPEPDVAWVRRRSYRRARPTALDVLLIVEVADTSLDYDMGEKAELYAAAGIADYWVVNIPENCLEIFRNAVQGRYQDHMVLKGPAVAHPLAFPEIALDLGILFPLIDDSE